MQNHNRKSGKTPSAKKQITQYDHSNPDQKIADHICHICISFKITFSHPTISSPILSTGCTYGFNRNCTAPYDFYLFEL